MTATKDTEIRAALHDKKLNALRNAPDTLVIDELGLSHAKARIDVAVINGYVHGYEIKSSLDTLDRLPTQIEFYSQCLEKLTLVCAPRHVDNALAAIPDWCGILEVKKGTRGGLSFTTVRKSAVNTDVSAVQLAHLLWRPEALALVARLDVSEKFEKMPRKELYEIIAAHLSIKQITAAIREFMQLRQAWRGRPARA
ncbi:sce7726 family protein [Tardiphaga sp. 803_E3_N1_3]|uniref:sce7726 family protein n=1 Tax=Tardiphaga sp. 803_E3_N1_3 TaxID=3240785 RepID=UPI003F20B951